MRAQRESPRKVTAPLASIGCRGPAQTMKSFRKRILLALMMVGVAALPASTPGCTKQELFGPGCQHEGQACGSWAGIDWGPCCGAMACVSVPGGGGPRCSY